MPSRAVPTALQEPSPAAFHGSSRACGLSPCISVGGAMQEVRVARTCDPLARCNPQKGSPPICGIRVCCPTDRPGTGRLTGGSLAQAVSQDIVQPVVVPQFVELDIFLQAL